MRFDIGNIQLVEQLWQDSDQDYRAEQAHLAQIQPLGHKQAFHPPRSLVRLARHLDIDSSCTENKGEVQIVLAHLHAVQAPLGLVLHGA